MSLFDIREELVDALVGTGVPVVGWGTAKVSAPMIVIDETDDWITPGDTLAKGSYALNLELFIITRDLNSKAGTKAMDDLIESALDCLGPWQVTNVSAHTRASIGSGTYLTSRISITLNIGIGG